MSATSIDADQICVFEFGYRANEVNNTVFTGVVGDMAQVEVEAYY